MPEEKPAPESTVLASAWSQVRAVLDLVLDFSFKRFVTPKLIRIIYAFSLVAAVLSAAAWVWQGLAAGLTSGMIALVTAPVAFLAYLLVARAATELVLAIFKIAEHVQKLEEKTHPPDKRLP